MLEGRAPPTCRGLAQHGRWCASSPVWARRATQAGCAERTRRGLLASLPTADLRQQTRVSDTEATLMTISWGSFLGVCVPGMWHRLVDRATSLAVSLWAVWVVTGNSWGSWTHIGSGLSTWCCNLSLSDKRIEHPLCARHSHEQTYLSTSLPSGTIRCSKFTLDFFSPSPGINHSLKEHWFILLKNDV